MKQSKGRTASRELAARRKNETQEDSTGSQEGCQAQAEDDSSERVGYCQRGAGTIYSLKRRCYFPARCRDYRGCPVCRRIRAERLAKQVTEEARAAGTSFGWTMVKEEDWAAFRKRLQRSDARYLRIPSIAGNLAVFTEYPDFAENRLPAPAGMMCGECSALTEHFSAWLELVPEDTRISSSRGFGGEHAGAGGGGGDGEWQRTPRSSSEIEEDLLALNEERAEDEARRIERDPQTGWGRWKGTPEEEVKGILQCSAPPLSEDELFQLVSQ